MSLRFCALANLDPAAAEEFGGKACGLARLMAASARVPDGFAVSASRSGPATWTATARAELLRLAAALLEHGPVAVRSSAIGEDAIERSCAGLLETVLGVGSAEALSAAAERCIAAGGSTRVLAYVGATEALPVGLVVQHQVRAAAAGVCFTLDPAGRDTAAVVEAVRGLGEQLVSGRVEPERWRAYRTGLGTWELHPDGHGGRTPVLELAQVESIAAEASRLAMTMGRPLDLEWALDGNGTLWWLQARPITAAKPAPVFEVERSEESAEDGPITLWSNWNVRETMPDPLLPLVWTLWRDVILPMTIEQLFGLRPSAPSFRHLLGLDLVQGRIYFNMNAVLGFPGPLGLAMSRMLGAMDSRTAAAVHELRRSGSITPRRVPRLGLGGHLRAWLTGGLRPALALVGALRPRVSLRQLAAAAAEISRRTELARLGDQELIEEMQLFARPECRRLRNGLQMEAVAGLVYLAARQAFREHAEAAGLLAVGLEHNPTTAISLELDELALTAGPAAGLLAQPLQPGELLARLEADPATRPWGAALARFLERHGHRGPKEFDLGQPRWADDPTMILELVRAGLRSSVPIPLAERMRGLAERRRRAVTDAVAAARPWRRPLMRLMARLVQLYMPLREAPKHYGMVAFQRMRQAALELGSRLARRGVLQSAEDVFFLEWPELVNLARGGPVPEAWAVLLARRRARVERFRLQPAPDLLRSDGVPVREPEGGGPASCDGTLRGTGVSPGRATGPVRVLNAPDPRAMQEGDVIVMVFADPGWTPLFPRAAAVVMEVGGLMCHAAVVARELGVPAVFGVAGATGLLTTGQEVSVDGDQGTVTVVMRDVRCHSSQCATCH